MSREESIIKKIGIDELEEVTGGSEESQTGNTPDFDDKLEKIRQNCDEKKEVTVEDLTGSHAKTYRGSLSDFGSSASKKK